jgi:hypothetical protein
MPVWASAIGALVLGMAAAMLAMLGLSAGTAYGRDYHDLTPRQRVMAKLLALGALLGAVAFAAVAMVLAIWTLRNWLQ